MFWGLIMEPNKRYSQTVEKAFHVSMATLDISKADDEFVQVMVCYENRNYLLCNLKKDVHWQVGLDLNFEEGTKIAFTSNGRGNVHLTGYLIPDDVDIPDEEDDESVEEEEEDEEVPQLTDKTGKRKANSASLDINQTKKRLKALEALTEAADSSEDDSDDDEDQDELENSVEAEHDTSEEGEEEEEEDEEVEDEDSEEEEEEEKKKEVAQSQKKNKQNKQELKNQKPQKSQTAIVNGKEPRAKQQKKIEKPQNESQEKNDSQQKKKFNIQGVQIEELKIGTGAPAKPGKFVSVYYVGKLKNGKKFDASTSGNGFKFRLGKGEVIKGWDVGVQGMKIGGKRRLIIPPQLAYGAKGSPPVIPPNSALTFEVELKAVH